MVDEALNILMKKCPRFQTCSAPKCPLDYNQKLRVYLKGDPICQMEKNVRLRIDKNSTLPLKGMTKAEWAGHQEWNKKSESEKQTFIAGGEATLRRGKKGIL